MRFALTKTNISDYGLCFLFEVLRDIGISRDIIEILYRVLIKIARTQHKEIQPIPEPPAQEEGAEQSEEEKQAFQKKVEEL